MPVKALYDTGTSMSCMAKMFFNTLPIKHNPYHVTGILQVWEAKH